MIDFQTISEYWDSKFDASETMLLKPIGLTPHPDISFRAG